MLAKPRKPGMVLANSLLYKTKNSTNPRANGAKRRSGRKPGARVTNFVLAFKVVARGS